MRLKIKKLGTKIVLSIVLCSIAMALLVGGISIWKSSSVVKEEASDKLLLIAQKNANNFNQLLYGVEKSISNLAFTSEAAFNMSEFKNNPNYIVNYQEGMNPIIKKFAANTKGSVAVYLMINPEWTNGVYGSWYANKGEDGNFQKMDFGSYENTVQSFNRHKKDFNKWSDIYLDKAVNKYMITYTKPIYVDNTLVGFVGMDIDFDIFKSEVKNIKVYDTGYAFLFNEKHDYLVHPNFTYKDNLKTIQNGELKSLSDKFNKNSEGISEYKFKGQDKILGYSRLSNGWVLCVAPPVNEIYKHIDETSTFILIIIAIGIIIFGIIGSIISKTISKPIIQLKKSFEEAAKGDLTVRTKIKGEDEVAKAGNSFNIMMENMNKLITEVKKLSNIVSESSSSLSKIIMQTNEVTNEIAVSMESISSSSSSQAQSTIDGDEKVRELGDEIELVVKSAQDMNKASSTVKHLSENGLNTLKSLVRKTNERSEGANNIYKAIDMNYKNSQEIESIVETVVAISEQTNLLSLNAAIEAARAGESGRGFSVVAEEIRKLAEESSKAVDQIKSLIQKIQNESENAVNILKGIKSVENEHENLVSQTDLVFQDIITNIEDLTKNIENLENYSFRMEKNKDNVVSVIDNLSYSAQEVAAGTEEVSSSIEEIASSLEEVSAYAQNLDSLVETLQEDINKFKNE